jgi:hypothetical protein
MAVRHNKRRLSYLFLPKRPSQFRRAALDLLWQILALGKILLRQFRRMNHSAVHHD